MKRLTDKSWLNTFQQRYPLKERIFLFYMFFFAGLSLLTIMANILGGLSFSFNYKWMAISGFSAALGILCLRRIRTALVHRVGIYALSLAVLPIAWLSSAGLLSPTIVYSTVVLLLINFLLVGAERIVLNALFLLVNMGLITLYHLHPEMFRSLTAQEQYLDWMVNIPLLFVFIALLLATFERAYEHERLLNVEKTRKLTVLSETDSLTGLLNRRHLSEDLADHLTACHHSGKPFAVLLLDIDYFKQFNDTYGHLQGDLCLQAMARVLRDGVKRTDDRVYRFGGEEFLILLKDSDQTGALAFARQLRADIAKAAIPHSQSPVSPVVTVSMGITICDAKGTADRNLLNEADEALYQAKASGRDRIECFNG